MLLSHRSTARRTHARALLPLVALAGVLCLSACGGDDADEPGATQSPTLQLDNPSASSDASSGVSDLESERAVKSTVKQYYEAVIEVNRRLGEGDALDATTTDRYRDQVLDNFDDSLFAEGNQLVGRWRLDFDDVELADDGSTATAATCVDGTEVFVVEAGDGVGSGARGQDRGLSTISLRRTDDGWKIDDITREDEPC